MAKIDCDCSGWATKANLKCGDGQTIMPGAFQDCDGMTVPVCWGCLLYTSDAADEG